MRSRPSRTEAAEYYFTYIDKVGEGDIVEILIRQAHEVQAFCEQVSEEMSQHRYGPDKWTIREVMGHLNDCERLFVLRAFWFARGFDTPLPSFDQNVAMAASDANRRNWGSHVKEFAAVRAATVAFFDGLPDEAWTRQGIASDNPFTVRALAYTGAGHVTHHLQILRSRYLSVAR